MDNDSMKEVILGSTVAVGIEYVLLSSFLGFHHWNLWKDSGEADRVARNNERLWLCTNFASCFGVQVWLHGVAWLQLPLQKFADASQRSTVTKGDNGHPSCVPKCFSLGSDGCPAYCTTNLRPLYIARTLCVGHPPSPAASQPLVKELSLGFGQLPWNRRHRVWRQPSETVHSILQISRFYRFPAPTSGKPPPLQWNNVVIAEANKLAFR